MIVYIVMYNIIQQVRKGTKPNSRLSLTVESRAVVGRVSSNSGAADQWWAVLESYISDTACETLQIALGDAQRLKVPNIKYTMSSFLRLMHK